MPDNASQLFKTGAISLGAYNKVARQTRHQKSKMADFNSRQKDEASPYKKGDTSVASGKHIDQNQRIAPKGLSGRAAAGPPSKGGQARGGTQPKAKQLDAAAFQKPAFPDGPTKSATKDGGGVLKSRIPGGGGKSPTGGTGPGTPSKAKGRIPARGGQYGGGGRNTQ